MNDQIRVELSLCDTNETALKLLPHTPANDDIVGRAALQDHAGRGTGVAVAASSVVVAGDEPLGRVAGRGDDDLRVEGGLVVWKGQKTMSALPIYSHSNRFPIDSFTRQLTALHVLKNT